MRMSACCFAYSGMNGNGSLLCIECDPANYSLLMKNLCHMSCDRASAVQVQVLAVLFYGGNRDKPFCPCRRGEAFQPVACSITGNCVEHERTKMS